MLREQEEVKLTNGSSKEPGIPFQDFLLFLFKSATTTPRSSQLSSSSSKSRNLDNRNIESAVLPSQKGSIDEIGREIRINRRYSCPDFAETETELYSSAETGSSTSSSFEITEDEYNNGGEYDKDRTQIYIDLYVVPSRPTSPLLLSQQMSTSSSTEEEEQEEVQRNTEDSTPTASITPVMYSMAFPGGRRRRELSFYRNFSATTRSKSSFKTDSGVPRNMSVNDVQSNHGDKKGNVVLLNKRFTRSMPSKLNTMILMMSRLQAMRLQSVKYSNGNNNRKTRPLVSLDKAEEKNGIIDPTLNNDQSALTTTTSTTTTSLFLDAVQLSQNQVDEGNSASLGILFQY